MNKRRRETIQAMIIAFLVANLGSITFYSLASKGWLGEWGKHRARYTNRKRLILYSSVFGPIFAVPYTWAAYKGAEIAERSKSK